MAQPPDIQPVALHDATRRRYLNYALSVITSRALPDVRDGLKPVQRRILYAMFVNLGLRPDARYRKSAAVVGEVMAKYHPHGDTSIYDALVRMAQPFSLRHTLVDGQGNFGSLDGDSAAAMRYTECKLRPLAVDLLSEIRSQTVDFRPNYDGQHAEPEVLPAQFPQLLVNGSEGIAVGMATRIPPHNLREVIDATVALIDDPDASVDQLCRKLRAPDFPTGGVILNSADELLDVYRTGSGTVRVRGRWTSERSGRKALAVIHEIPYGINKATLVEKIGQLVAERKIPQITDVRDESTDVVRVVLELRAPEDAPAALAYLFKHTALQSGFPVNLTCLIPPAGGGLPAPTRADLRTILQAWLSFRFRTVERRFDHELQQLRARIHILIAFAAVFDALDEAIRLIRTAEGRREAHERLVERFDFDDTQAQAVLELQLYKLAKLEINEIRAELAEKQARADEIERILGDEAALWAVCRKELLDIRAQYGEPRRTRVGPHDDEPEVSYDEDNYIVAEDAYVIITRDGWIKRLASFGGLEKLRVREGDSVGWVLLAATTATVCFFTDQGSAYTLRVDAVPATTGYGEPVQKHFKFADGERVVGVATSDPRGRPPAGEGEEGELGPFGVAAARNGKGSRFLLSGVLEPSTRNGRRYAKVEDPTEAVVGVQLCEGSELVLVVSRAGQALALPAAEVNLVRGAGKGVMLLKIDEDDALIAIAVKRGPGPTTAVQPAKGPELALDAEALVGKRGGAGKAVARKLAPCAWAPTPERLDLLFAVADEGDAPEAPRP
jgi:DNA gyrase subunit A